MDERKEASSPEEESKRTASMFLSVYLLLLAFFIVLNSISTFQEVRAQAVMDSLTSTFATLLPSRSTTNPSQTGRLLGARETLKKLGEVFETAIPAAKVRVVQAGLLLQVTLPVDALFLAEKPDIRPAQGALLNRIAAALGSPPGGVRYEMVMLLGSTYAEGGGLPIGETLAMARAGTIGREMMRRGAAPETVAVGIEAGDPMIARVLFRVLGEEDTGSEGGRDE